LSKCGFPRFDKRDYWQIKWFAENGWTSWFCGCNVLHNSTRAIFQMKPQQKPIQEAFGEAITL
jgi:hypothetical protein